MLLLLVICLQLGRTQLLIAQQVFKYLEQKFEVSFSVATIKINPFGDFEFHHFLIQDHHQDTLVYLQNANGSLIDIKGFTNKTLSIKNLSVANGWVRDVTYDKEQESSLAIFSKKFKTSKKSKQPFVLKIDGITTNNLRYARFKNQKPIVDFKQVSGRVQKLRLRRSSVSVLTDSLSFEDVYGIQYQKLATDFSYNTSKMSFKNTQITTNNSDVLLDVNFNYQPTYFSDFINKVQVSGFVSQSEVSLQDIHKIYPHFNHPAVFNLTSKVSGVLNDLVLTEAKITSEDESFLVKGKILLKNSIANREDFEFKINNAVIDIKPSDLKKIVPDVYRQKLPKTYQGVENLNYLGSVEVTNQKVELSGDAVTNIGNISLKGVLRGLNTDNNYLDVKIFKGFLVKHNQLKGLKNVGFKGFVKGNVHPKNLDVHTYLKFKKLNYQNVKLSDTYLKASLGKNNFDAFFESKDSLLNFSAQLNQLQAKNQKKYNVDFEVREARLSKLFPKSTTYQKNMSTAGHFIFEQDTIGYHAKGNLAKLHIDTTLDSLDLSNVDVYLNAKQKNKTIKLNSKDLIDVNVEGMFEFSDLEKMVENAVYKFMPGTQKREVVGKQKLKFNTKVYPKFIRALTDKVRFDDPLKISGILSSKNDKGVINATIASMRAKDILLDSLEVVLDNSNQWINTNVSVQKIKFKKQTYKDLSFLGKKVNDTLFIRSNFQSDKITNKATLYLTSQKDIYSLGIEDVYLKYENAIWKNKTQSQNKIDYNYRTKDWVFNQLSFANEQQQFQLDGTVKKDHSKNIELSFKNINLTEILPEVDSLNIGGIATGKVFFKEKNTLLRPKGSLEVKSLKINGVQYGKMLTSIEPNNQQLGYNLNFNITNQKTKSIYAKGEILVDKSNFLDSKINLKVVLDNLKLNSLSPLGKNVLSAIRGKAKGNFTVSGQLNNFDSDGTIVLNNAGLKFPYLNTDYNFVGNANVKLKGKKFVFDNIGLQDVLHGTKGSIQGNINYDKYNNWNLNLKIDSKNLLVLNTPKEEKAKYYGTAFMQGLATIKGPTTDLKINVTGTTLPNTKFILPISDLKQAENSQFISFKKLETDQVAPLKQPQTIGGVSVVLNLDITKDALGEVVIDQTSGSSLQGRTNGRLLVDIDKLFNIKMYGDLVVDQGLYNFKYGGFINKPFVVKKGGTISWNGDPYKAALNIEAIHQVKANPKVLLENLTVNRKLDVDLVTKVTGEIFDSKQSFMIEIPNASSTVSSELDFKLNTDENSKMRQFFSLLVTKNFYDENNANNTGSVFTNTTSEIISNTITEIFNKEDDKFKINFGYTAGETSELEDIAIDDQIDIAMTTEINDRVLINGKLGVPVGARTQATVVGEVKVEFLLNKQGTLRSSVFNRQNEIQYSEEEQGYTQGLGLSYQINFNNLTEMLYKIGLKKNKEKADKKEKYFDITDDKIFEILPDLF